MNQIPSIRELARHVGMSIGTVSRALNGRADVSAETRRRVVAAAAELGYSPNQSGRSLRQGSTGMVALMIPTSADKPLSDTIFMSVLDGLRRFLAERRLDLMVLLSGPEEHPGAYLRRVVQRRLADGIIISETQRQDRRIDDLIARHIPFVAFGRSLSGGAHPWIDLDFESVAQQAVARLFARGHRRIALATRRSEINYGYLFAEAYRDALVRFGIGVDPALIFREPGGDDSGYRLGEALLALRERPTAVILVDASVAIGLYRRLAEAGLEAGRDLAVIGFQDWPSGQFLNPRLTCFKAELGALGERLGQALLAMMPGHGQPRELIQEVWPMTLIEGDSDNMTPGPRRTERARPETSAPDVEQISRRLTGEPGDDPRG